MPATTLVTLGSLVERVREAAEMEGSEFVTDLEIKRKIYKGLRTVRTKLLAAGQEVDRRTAYLNTVPGQTVYPLPDNFYRSLAVIAYDVPAPPVDPARPEFIGPPAGGSTATNLDPFEMQQLADLLSRSWSCPADTRYRQRGDAQGRQLELQPAPRYTFGIRIEYLTPLEPFDGDDLLEFDGYDGFEEIAVLQAAIYCKGKEQSDTRDLRVDLAEEMARLDGLADAMDRGRPAVVVDTQGLLEPAGGYGRGRGYP